MLEHQGTLTIKTPRLWLRKASEKDAPALFEGCLGNQEVNVYMSRPIHKNADETSELIRTWVSLYEDPSFYTWVLEDEHTSAAVGIIELKDVSDWSARGSIEFQLRKDHWGQGLMTEALAAVLNYLFGSVGFNRLEACHASENYRAGAVLRTSGFLYEGMAREKFYTAGGYRDAHNYGILKSDRRLP